MTNIQSNTGAKTHDKQSGPLWAMFAVILLWSSSPLALVRCGDILPQPVLASVAVLLAFSILCLFFGLVKREVLKEAVSLLTLQMQPAATNSMFRGYIAFVGLSICGFVAYPWLYVQAMNAAGSTPSSSTSVSNAIVVNVLNYLWPCFAVIFSCIGLRESFRLRRLSGVGMAFAGALLSVSSITGSRDWVLSWIYGTGLTTKAAAPIGLRWFFLFAVLGAIVWGLYSAFLPRSRFIAPNGVEISSSAFFVAMLAIACPVHCVYLITQWRLFVDFRYSVTPGKLFFFLLYSAGSLGAAHCLYSYVLRSKRISMASIVASTYFVFAFGTFLLFFISHPVMSLPIVAGFGLIACGIFLARDTTFTSPIHGFIVFFIISYGLSAFFSPDHAIITLVGTQDGSYFDFLETMTGLFAIIGGFTLAKAGTRFTENRRQFSNTVQAFASLIRALEDSPDLSEPFLRLSKTLQKTFTLSHTLGANFNLTLEAEEFRSEIDTLSIHAERLEKSSPAPHNLNDVALELRRSSADWLSTNVHAVTNYEWLVLICLAIMLMLVGYRITLHEPLFRLARAGFDSGLVMILFAIADLDRSRPETALSYLRLTLSGLPMAYRDIATETEVKLQTSRLSELVLVVSVIVFWVLSYFIH